MKTNFKDNSKPFALVVSMNPHHSPYDQILKNTSMLIKVNLKRAKYTSNVQ